ncbi:MAG: hypothetical protein DCC71_11920 [Proteobacteria bacterium]|nr:MAG: hypothetical protein DCC71_11920 [Pseudomonadota bacterium]
MVQRPVSFTSSTVSPTPACNAAEKTVVPSSASATAIAPAMRAPDVPGISRPPPPSSRMPPAPSGPYTAERSPSGSVPPVRSATNAYSPAALSPRVFASCGKRCSVASVPGAGSFSRWSSAGGPPESEATSTSTSALAVLTAPYASTRPASFSRGSVKRVHVLPATAENDVAARASSARPPAPFGPQIEARFVPPPAVSIVARSATPASLAATPSKPTIWKPLASTGWPSRASATSPPAPFGA